MTPQHPFDERKPSLRAKFHAWLRSLDLDENEVIGTHVDPVFAGFMLGDEQTGRARAHLRCRGASSRSPIGTSAGLG
jgi:hypothetical protein